MSLGNYDAWKCREPEQDYAEPDDDEDFPDDSSIERLLEDARLGDTVASVTLVEACERALDVDASQDEAKSARQHIAEYLGKKRPCSTCGKPGHRPMDHAGWHPDDDQR